MGGMGMGQKPISVKLAGDIWTIWQTLADLAEKIKRIKGTRDVTTSWKQGVSDISTLCWTASGRLPLQCCQPARIAVSVAAAPRQTATAAYPSPRRRGDDVVCACARLPGNPWPTSRTSPLSRPLA